jgi:hypothetical protein
MDWPLLNFKKEPRAMRSALPGSYYVCKKYAEAPNQQDGARRQRNFRDQGYRDAGEYNDPNDRKRERAIVNEQPG